MKEKMPDRSSVDPKVDYFYIVSNKYDSFSKSEKIIADFLLEDKMLFLTCSITSLARKIGVSPASITRFCQKLNYGGFSELKYNIANNALLPIEKEERLTVDDSVGNIITKLIRLDNSAILDSLVHLNPDLIKVAARAICKAQSIHIYAEGGPASTANYAYQLLFQLGLQCQFFSDVQMALTSALQLQPGDVAMYICRTGRAKNMIRAVRIAKERKVTILGITADPESKMATLSDIVLSYSSRIENNLRYLHIARICEMSIIGVLFNAIINYLPEKQVTEKALSSSHAISINQE